MLRDHCANFKKAPWLGAFFVCALLLSSPARARTYDPCSGKHIDQWARVVYVDDGDTIRLSDGQRVRFISINAPELAHDGRPIQPVAEQARQRLLQLLPVGSRVGLQFGRRHFGPHHRLLAHVFDVHRRNIGALLVREGLAFTIAIPPDLSNYRCYFRQEAIARSQRRGIWHLKYFRVWPARECAFIASTCHTFPHYPSANGRVKPLQYAVGLTGTEIHSI